MLASRRRFSMILSKINKTWPSSRPIKCLRTLFPPTFFVTFLLRAFQHEFNVHPRQASCPILFLLRRRLSHFISHKASCLYHPFPVFVRHGCLPFFIFINCRPNPHRFFCLSSPPRCLLVVLASPSSSIMVSPLSFFIVVGLCPSSVIARPSSFLASSSSSVIIRHHPSSSVAFWLARSIQDHFFEKGR